MAEVLDWRRIGKPDIAGRFIAATLRRGEVVVMPTETSYVACAFGLLERAVDRLRSLAGASVLELAMPEGAAVHDWLPGLGSAGRRVINRLWPGPVTLVSCEGMSLGLIQRLPDRVQSALSADNVLRLRPAVHPAIREVLHRLPGPLVQVPVPAGEAEAFTIREVVDHFQSCLLIDDGPARHRQPTSLVEVAGNNYTVRREGAVPADSIREALACSIVFVCTGNTCRSPLAEALCKKRLAEALGCQVEELPARGYRVSSAGLAAGPGFAAAREAIEVGRAMGADLEKHQSQPLTAELLEQVDHLLVMTRGHAQALANLGPGGGVVAELLSPEGTDVSDPIGQGSEVYEACARQLDGYIEAFLRRLGLPGSST